MTPTTLAAALIKDVPRFDIYEGDILFSIQGTWVTHREVLAALTAAMDPAIAERAGDVAKRLDAVSLDVGYSSTTTLDSGIVRQAADMLTALLAQNAALRARNSQLYFEREENAKVSDLAQSRLTAAEAQIAALTARVEGLTGALQEINVGEGWAAQIARAALSATEEGHE